MLHDQTDADAFYDELTKRNRGLIGDALQQRLRDARIVIAGCGSTGGAAVMPLVRTGATDFVVADPDVFELSNLNRQNATVDDVGANKAEVAARHIRSVNPHAKVTVLQAGIPDSNVSGLLSPRDVVIDAIDVTTVAGLGAKKALHDAASRIGVPVITAYDIAGTQFIEVFDYRKGGAPLGGKVAGKDSPSDVLAALIPPTALPEEILPIVAAGPAALEEGFPQLAMTANLFGALVVPIALKLLGDTPLPKRMTVDLAGITTPAPRKVMRRIRTLVKLPTVWLRATKRGRS